MLIDHKLLDYGSIIKELKKEPDLVSPDTVYYGIKSLMRVLGISYHAGRIRNDDFAYLKKVQTVLEEFGYYMYA